MKGFVGRRRAIVRNEPAAGTENRHHHDGSAQLRPPAVISRWRL